MKKIKMWVSILKQKYYIETVKHDEISQDVNTNMMKESTYMLWMEETI